MLSSSKSWAHMLQMLNKQARILTQIQHSRSLSHGNSSSDNHQEFQQDKNYVKHFLKVASILGIGTIAVWADSRGLFAASPVSSVSEETKEYGALKPGLPEYTSEDVTKHNTLETRVWMSFRYGVYDVTDFIHEHPGGDAIMLGAGGSVEPFWASYAVHKNPHVLKLFEKYRIGNLSVKDVGADTKNMLDPYANEPKRHASLIPSSKQPFNAEPLPSLLVENLRTPNEIFYVRNHLPVPEVRAETYELDIDVLGAEEKTLTLEDIKKRFPKHTITAAIQCGGNRRSEMAKIKYVKGLNWRQAAISNAEWSGAKLCDVLKSLGVAEGTKALHVQFEGMDVDPTSSPYGASIPIKKAIDPHGDVLLAYEMNGVPLPTDHGFPIRVVVPGAVGARSVKWLGRIIVSEEESQTHWQQNDYKGFAPNINWDNVDFTKSPAIQDMPVTSAVCLPREGDAVTPDKEGKIEVKGYAYSGGGRKIIRVDVSSDGGKNWQEADELVSDQASHPQAWGWTLWRARVPVVGAISGEKETEIVVKAVDSSYNTQPESFANIWNLRGVLSNAYHRVRVRVKQ